MLRYIKTGMMLLSIAYIVIGMMLLVMPQTSLLWICYAFGAVVLITGIVCLVQYARIRGTGFTAPFMLVGGVITACIGVFTLVRPQVVASFLPVVFGIFIVVDGLSRVGTAIDLAKRKGQKWGLLLLLSLVSVALGVVLVLHPFDAAIGVTMLCGILLIVEGALNLAACCMRHGAAHAGPHGQRRRKRRNVRHRRCTGRGRGRRERYSHGRPRRLQRREQGCVGGR